MIHLNEHQMNQLRHARTLEISMAEYSELMEIIKGTPTCAWSKDMTNNLLHEAIIEEIPQLAEFWDERHMEPIRVLVAGEYAGRLRTAT